MFHTNVRDGVLLADVFLCVKQTQGADYTGGNLAVSHKYRKLKLAKILICFRKIQQAEASGDLALF